MMKALSNYFMTSTAWKALMVHTPPLTALQMHKVALGCLEYEPFKSIFRTDVKDVREIIYGS